jgi:pimeloyl-ACP methyl ester carboxylesterase
VEREIERAAARIALDDDGAGLAIVGLHGLTATRRYVLMGARSLERGGRRVVLYDARGHGVSAPAPDGDYSYGALAADLLAVLDGLAIDRAVLVGASMGAHTAVRFALERPERVAALALVTPAFDPDAFPSRLDHWDALSAGLRTGGIEGFLAAYDFDRVPEAWRETVRTVTAQRLALHENLDAVADALSAVPRSAPFGSYQELASIQAPTLIVATRDEADPDHPYATAERYAAAIANATFLAEEPGKPPIAWQGGQLSRAVQALATTI